MKKILLANIKANLSPGAASEWLEDFVKEYQQQDSVEVILAVPFLYMKEIYTRIRELEGVCLAAQGVSPYPGGNYTGATPASWLEGLVQYAMVGHRERRKYFHETAQDCAAQVRECIAGGIQPVLCLGDTGITDVRAALESEELAKVIPAYTPDSAVALEKVRKIAGIQEGIARLQGYFPGRPVVYGGGVNSENGREILDLPDVSGIMLGRGCLDARALNRLIAETVQSA